MTARFFVDSNILLYSASAASDDVDKRARAREVLRLPGIGFSAQVMQEFYDAGVRKKRLEITPGEGQRILEGLAAFPVIPVTREIVLAAVRLTQRYQISYWDAAILTAAKELGAATVFSEDMNHGQIYDGVTVLNPFLPGVQLPATGSAESQA